MATHKQWIAGLISGKHVEGAVTRAQAAAALAKRPRPAAPRTDLRNVAGVDANNRTTRGVPLPWTPR